MKPLELKGSVESVNGLCDGDVQMAAVQVDVLAVRSAKPDCAGKLVALGKPLRRRSAPAPASPSRGPGNGILRAETGGLFQAQNAGEQSEFGSQTTLRLTNQPELRGFLSTRKPPQFVGTAWWWTQSSRTSLRS